MKRLSKLAFAAAFCASALSSASARPEPQSAQTTKILAIGTLREGIDPARVQSVLPTEIAQTVTLYLAGRIDQWYSLEDRPGVAFVLNMTDVEAARRVLEDLPFGRARLMSFELVRLGPLNPLRRLLPRMQP